jgi:hypothetical protein
VLLHRFYVENVKIIKTQWYLDQRCRFIECHAHPLLHQ